MARGSQHSDDEISWTTAAVRPGRVGLDLRDEVAPHALKQLVNARFVDEANLSRRDGYTGHRLQDSSDFPASFDGALLPVNTAGWVYGHGQTIVGGDAATPDFSEDAHVPFPGVARGAFELGGTHIGWTGDRLLAVRDDGTALGGSSFWDYSGAPAWGIPAMLPVQTTTSPPEAFTATYADTCLTTVFRVVVAAQGGTVVAWTSDRETGVLLNRSVLGTSAKDIRVVNSNDTPVILWRETDLRVSHWTGTGWTSPSVIADPVQAFDTTPTALGFHLVYRSDTALSVTEFRGAHSSGVNYPPAYNVTTTNAANGPVAICVTPTGTMALVYSGLTAGGQNVVCIRTLTAAAVTIDEAELASDAAGWNAITASSRVLRRCTATSRPTPIVIHAEANATVHTWEVLSLTPSTVLASDQRYNSKLASHSFTVGNEVFAWLRCTNHNTHYLIAGSKNYQVCGYADREEGAVRADDGVQGLQTVQADPLHPTHFTWLSVWDPGEFPISNMRIGDIDFLPTFCAVQYGKSVYLAGSAVRNWDGVFLGDAGFQDYPKVTNKVAAGSGGNLDAGAKRYRVYAVRYNALGERFQSAAETTGAITVVASDRVTLTIATLPCTNGDVTFEVYTTEAGGTTYYLEGTVANSLSAATVSYDSTISDATLRTRFGDPHAPGVGVAAEVEEFGPLGCSILAVIGDRLWGAGGQVSAGYVQFSKLKEAGEGAGFDDVNGTQQVDLVGATVTSLAAADTGPVVFQRDVIYVLTGPGPDNYGNGSFGVPTLVLSDGAINHVGTESTQAGIIYWGVDGPRFLDQAFRVQNISVPIHSLTSTLTPTGVQVDLARQEAVWFTDGGTAVLLNYRHDPRWAVWSGLTVAGCSGGALAMTDGRVLFQTADADDAGVPFAFSGMTEELNGDASLNGSTLVGQVGVAGTCLGPHNLRLRVYYNKSPAPVDEWLWEPDVNTRLQSSDDLGTLTPAQIDALSTVDRSGAYTTVKRTSVSSCRSFRIEWSDVSSHTPTLLLQELSYTIGSRGGFARVPVNTFGA